MKRNARGSIGVAGDTEMDLGNGLVAKAEDVQTGMVIMSAAGFNPRVRVVAGRNSEPVGGYVTLHLSDGKSLKAAHDQGVAVLNMGKRSWRRASFIIPGCRVITMTGGSVGSAIVKSVEMSVGNVSMHYFKMLGDGHSFFAGGVLLR